MLTVNAPAKLNLTFEVLGKQPDGYHQIRSVIQAISLGDRLTFRVSYELGFRSNLPDWSAGESLVSRAAQLLRVTAGCSEGAIVEVEKRIPLVSGLGGDSSDAAAALYGLNELWKLGLSGDKLLELAAQLGSDVPFFLHGGTALAEGRGEKITPLPAPPRSWLVLVVPAVPRLPGKTGRMYASLNARHYTDGQITERLTDVLRGGGDFSASLLFNTFENVAFTEDSELRLYRDHLLKMGADNVHLAGSGPTLFTLSSDRQQAVDLYALCRQQGMETYLVEAGG